MVSWRFKEKTTKSGDEFTQMIFKNPGYDLYHINPYYDEVTKFANPFVNGDIHHPGMLYFVNRLLSLMGYKLDMSKIQFDKDNFIFCSYYVGNSRFWDHWMSFLDIAMWIANNDQELNYYLYNTYSNHLNERIINFSFVVERMVNLFLYLYKSEYKIKGFR